MHKSICHLGRPYVELMRGWDDVWMNRLDALSQIYELSKFFEPWERVQGNGGDTMDGDDGGDDGTSLVGDT